ncbi:MAG: hypothetical protein L0387_36610, partial [Acidobacteria bacterium]|nr:hypothetical protein [Acidobacteriota bacterium]
EPTRFFCIDYDSSKARTFGDYHLTLCTYWLCQTGLEVIPWAIAVARKCLIKGNQNWSASRESDWLGAFHQTTQQPARLLFIPLRTGLIGVTWG